MPNEPFVATASFTTVDRRRSERAHAAAASPRRRRAAPLARACGTNCCCWAVVVALVAAARRRRALAASITAGSDLGYWLGRRRRRRRCCCCSSIRCASAGARCARSGSTRFWFALHMTLGIVGPLLIILHSTLAFGSLNATVAFASMALVATSGIVGRFLYGAHPPRALRPPRDAGGTARAGRDWTRRRCARSSRSCPRSRSGSTEFARRADADRRQAGLGHPLRFMALGLAREARAALVHGRGQRAFCATARSSRAGRPSKLARRDRQPRAR